MWQSKIKAGDVITIGDAVSVEVTRNSLGKLAVRVKAPIGMQITRATKADDPAEIPQATAP